MSLAQILPNQQKVFSADPWRQDHIHALATPMSGSLTSPQLYRLCEATDVMFYVALEDVTIADAH
jgi:hypothetical protein